MADLRELDYEAAEQFVEDCLEPFGEGQVGKKPQYTCQDCSKRSCKTHAKQWCETCKQTISTAHMHIDFVGHAHMTAKLLKLDPFWSWEPVAFDEEGLPKIRVTQGQASLWIRLTVCGITRLGVGVEPVEKFGRPNDNLLKELIGDALRNAGMRFGLALNLWAKGELLEADETSNEQPPAEPEAPAEPKPAAQKAATAPRKAATAPPAKKTAKAQPPAKKAATARSAPPAADPSATEGKNYPMKGDRVDLPKLFARIKGDARQSAMAALGDNPVMSDEGVVAAWPLPSERTLGESGEPLSPEALDFVIGEVVETLEEWAKHNEYQL